MNESRDPAEYDEASYEVDFASLCDDEQAEKYLSEICSGAHQPSDSKSGSYREASERMIHVLNKFITFIVLKENYKANATIHGIGYALGHPITAGKTMLETARELGCTKQAISKVACDFLAYTGLPPSPALKSEEAKKTYKITNGNHRKITSA